MQQEPYTEAHRHDTKETEQSKDGVKVTRSKCGICSLCNSCTNTLLHENRSQVKTN